MAPRPELDRHRDVFCHDPRWGHWFVPGVRARILHERGGYFIVTNSAGARCSRDFGQKQPGENRVLVVGDSFSAGDGVDNRERYSDLLERHLDGVSVLNVALSGSGTDQQVLIHDAFASSLDPDVLLFAPAVHNIRRNVQKTRTAVDPRTGERMLVPKPYFTLDNGSLVLHGVPVPRPEPARDGPEPGAPPATPGLRERLVSLARDALLGPASSLAPLARRLSGHRPLPEYDDLEGLAWKLLQALTLRLFESSRARVKLLVPLPLHVHIEGGAPANHEAPLRAVAALAGATYVDVLPAFRALTPAERRACRFEVDTHYSPRGHEVVARAVAAALVAMGVAKPAAGRLA